jgi:hypothetical protein
VADLLQKLANLQRRLAPMELCVSRRSIVVAGRFSENLFVQTDYRVGAEDDVLRGGDDGPSLVFGNSPNELSCAFAGVAMLRNGAGPDDVINAGG